MNDQITTAEVNKLLSLAERCLNLSGDFVELGCYRGNTSVLLGKLLQPTPKTLWIYDSFAGLPEKTPEDSSGAGANFQSGELTVSKNEVVTKIRRSGLNDIRIKKAWFDDLMPADLPEEISFAFIDGDFYRSQKQGLKLVSPLLTNGGIIICHDYNNPELPGASQAVDEFLCQNPQYKMQVYQSLAILQN